MEDLMILEYIGVSSTTSTRGCLKYQCDITRDLKDITNLEGEFIIVSSKAESMCRIEYNGISIGDLVLRRTKDSGVIFKIQHTSLYMGNFFLIPEFNNTVINKIYKYLKDLEKYEVCVMY